ncbi:MAG: M48 family metalloprotease [Inquilinus sp.]|nr:M48 family metalloprotease [Inquilinus sp.]
MLRRIVTAFAVALAIPVVGVLIADWIINDLTDGIGFSPEVMQYCADTGLFASDACGVVHRLALLRTVSLISGIAAFDLMALYFAAALVAGGNRGLNAILFPILLPISLLVISGLVFAQGAIATYAVAIAEIHLIDRLHFWLVGAIAIGALVGGVKLILALIGIRAELVSRVFGKAVDARTAPALWRFVGEIAQKLGAKQPDNIVVGLEPTFFATAADLHVINDEQRLSGETLFLSLPLMRLFDLDELRAVIGHELGHFRGADTAYSLKFAPVYGGLSRAIEALDEQEKSAAGLATLPAMSMLSLMLELFARNERTISRAREYEADKACVSVAGAEPLATSLGKVAVYAPLWGKVREENVERLNQGKVTANLSKVYEDAARYDVSHKAVGTLVREILETKIAHPTDSHPTIDERFRNIGFDPEALSIDKLVTPGGSGAELIEDAAGLERELTVQEHRLMVMMGYADPPPSGLPLPAGRNAAVPDATEAPAPAEAAPVGAANPIYSLAAELIAIDGQIDPQEISVAEDLGARMVDGFDRVEFRECCAEAATLPDYHGTVDALAGTLQPDRKLKIYDFLKSIALADGELPPSERQFLLFVRQSWGI